MPLTEIEEQCELGQRLLMEMQYLQAERVLADAEARAWEAQEWDVLSRLYLPLQETRRQRRQRCGEGAVCLDLAASSALANPDPSAIVQKFPLGQLLVAGWGTVAPSAHVRQLAWSGELYLETFLAAVYPVENARVIVIVPRPDVPLPLPGKQTIEELRRALPENCLLLSSDALPVGSQKGTADTYALTMALWERLHAPFLAAAELAADPIEKMRLFRETLVVDYACELAHQHLADVARQLRRLSRIRP